MKRTAPLKRSALARRTPLRSVPKPSTPDSGREAWKTPRWGRCENCGLIDVLPLQGHHVVARQVVARAGGNEWDPANRMDLCERCHMNSEFGQENRKIPVEKIPDDALAFAVDLLGEEQAAFYIRRRYRCEGE